mmetsp:Transcript_30347/g.79569  ORF Transcript_30347/g.79569 Transcript_30347/m.79569 type:complete len:237 (+) Transcript_30347:71-781(+)
MVLWTKVDRFKRLLSLTTKPNTKWRQEFGLLKPDKQAAVMKKGWPQFDQVYDPAKVQDPPPTYKKYVPPPKPKPFIVKDSDYYHEDNLHELMGKFQFEVKGRFYKRGELAEREIFDAAFGLHLVGWLKVRSMGMLGHVQGDTVALSYFRRWLEEKHLSSSAGVIEWVRLWEINTGIELPLKYGHLVCVKDHRKYKTRKVHILATLEKSRLQRLVVDSAVRRQQEEAFLDANCVRTY